MPDKNIQAWWAVDNEEGGWGKEPYPSVARWRRGVSQAVNLKAEAYPQKACHYGGGGSVAGMVQQW